MSIEAQLTAAVLLTLLHGAVGEHELCYSWADGYEVYDCYSGCCGNYLDQYCCPSTGTIAGAVIGGLVFLGIIIAVVCCCVKSHGHHGTLIAPAGPNIAVVQANVGTNMYGQMATTTHGYIQQPLPQPGYSGPPGYSGAMAPGFQQVPGKY
ncbi:hypothetical protein ScPMuIL_007995 [Solemya velum]